jgi:hypothetical protein
VKINLKSPGISGVLGRRVPSQPDMIEFLTTGTRPIVWLEIRSPFFNLTAVNSATNHIA